MTKKKVKPEVQISDLSSDQMKSVLTELEVSFPEKAKVSDLEDLIQEKLDGGKLHDVHVITAALGQTREA